MAKKIEREPWSEDEERQIDMAAEARVRAAKRLRADEAAEQQFKLCAEGKHAAIEDGICTACGEKPKAPSTKEKARLSLLG